MIAVILLILLALALLAVLLWGITFVPQSFEYCMSRAGKYSKTFKTGAHWFFKPFRIIKIDSKIYMGDKTMEMHMGVANGKQDVDFKDVSAPVKVKFHYRIFDSYLATYAVSDVIEMVADKAEHVVRAFFAQYDVLEANGIKGELTLDIIASSVKVTKDANGNVVIPPVPDFNTTLFYQTLTSWGVEALGFLVDDIVLPESIVAQRERELQAAIDVEVSKKGVEKAKYEAKTALIKAKNQKDIEILRATGEADGMNKISAAMAERIKVLVSQGIDPKEAAAYVRDLAKTEALQNAERVTWIEGSPVAQIGATFGAGQITNNQ